MTFEMLIEEYYQRFLLYGDEEANIWLNDMLYTQDARDAVKDFITRSMEQAEEIMRRGDDAAEDYILDKEMPSKKKEIH